MAGAWFTCNVPHVQTKQLAQYVPAHVHWVQTVHTKKTHTHKVPPLLCLVGYSVSLLRWLCCCFRFDFGFDPFVSFGRAFARRQFGRFNVGLNLVCSRIQTLTVQCAEAAGNGNKQQTTTNNSEYAAEIVGCKKIDNSNNRVKIHTHHFEVGLIMHDALWDSVHISVVFVFVVIVAASNSYPGLPDF